ncbi:ATP-binding protein [Sphingobacterium sp. UT-1RO-CII-1]|uniref:AAA family ATPase n=1 Tax=Sphingobacterium sp. UT-1RO-CII-1 TaxID=2995225 RepID=UPI00227BCE78|nr:ATP-binding protein [Sphingobacterium sp. UT-1RO-CII-1]MCY4781339.1 ATP-binding protein [Sphingobacterium sp. UT-1RO-CII-1]
MSLSSYVIQDREKIDLNDIRLSAQNREQLDQLLKENLYTEKLQKYNLPVNNKLMLHGPSGCGKTSTAKAIAQKLGKNLYILDLSTIVSSRIGETAINLKSVFQKVARERAVLFIDEFDHIGKARGGDEREVGEMRRMVNTLIQLIDYFPENSLLIAATNHLDIVDQALVRRFQIVLTYEQPSKAELDSFYEELLLQFPEQFRTIDRVYDISYAETKDHVFTAVKRSIIADIELQGM